MAETASLTLANVKSSAMSPRHPEVPNLMGDVVMRRYSRPETVESRKLKDKSRDPKHAALLRALARGKVHGPSGGSMVKRGEGSRIVLVMCATLTEGRRIARRVVSN